MRDGEFLYHFCDSYFGHNGVGDHRQVVVEVDLRVLLEERAGGHAGIGLDIEVYAALVQADPIRYRAA